MQRLLTITWILLLNTWVGVVGQESPSTKIQKHAASTEVIPVLPEPSGTFGIGRGGFDWMDSRRYDRSGPDPQPHRELMVYVWYPTSPKDGHAKGIYLPGTKAADGSSDVQPRMRDEFGERWPQILSGAIYSHAVDGAPVASTPKQFPVVISRLTAIHLPPATS